MPFLRRFRVITALLVALAVAAAFLDYRDLVSSGLKRAVGAAQFGPSLIAFAGGTALSFACVGVLVLTALVGRVYCSTICPLGLLQDAIARVAALVRKLLKIKKKRLPFRRPDHVLRQGILVVTVLCVVAGWGGFAMAWLDPYSHFGRVAGALFRPPVLFINNTATTVLEWVGRGAWVPRVPVPWAGIGAFLPPLIIFGVVAIVSALRGRLYCNAICPVGTLLGWASRRALFRLAIDKTACGRCGDCTGVCKAQCIDLRAQTVDFSRCVACFNCVAVCDKAAIRLAFRGRAKARGAVPLRAPRPVAAQPVLTRREFVAGAGGVAALAGGFALLGGGHFASAAASNSVTAPPGALSRKRFIERCTACQLCVSTCPSHVLAPALSHYGTPAGFMKPYMNYTDSFCNINCTVCMDVCPDGALVRLPLAEKQVSRLGLAEVTIERCIVRASDTACGACAEHCPTAALQFVKGKRTYDEPKVNKDLCIGCGACEFACPALPVKAIIIRGFEKHEKAVEMEQEKAEDPNADKTSAGEFPF
ncbi:MAG: 4Fe-4S binding protein [Puniceicoccales bacterium]|nr:4Fe-4S binding protein [Puniceicoccales bacterium]